MTFRDDYLDTFKLVCWHLGSGWRVIQLPGEQPHTVRLKNPDLREFTIEATKSEGRLFLIAKVADNAHYKGQYYRCTTALNRPAKQIAGDIRRKLIQNAAARIEEHQNNLRAKATEKGNEDLILSALSRLLELGKVRSWSREYTYRQSVSGLKGHIEFVKYNETFEIGIRGLSGDNLLKIVGFMSTLLSE